MFKVSVTGPRVTATYVGHSAADAVAKVKEFELDIRISITDPVGFVWVPNVFDALLARWRQ